ncbi:MAG: ATP-binding cassette domain-containing protein [Nodularia sp. (in: Bacteria)]|nr:MAG: ATP-binding cassette domain-containing protein [Nodularia sp. (in: cyanobacteria)]
MNVIEIDNINYARSYIEHPLENIQLTVKQGELIHLKGETGAGKSTLIDILLGIKYPDSGTVKIFGSPPSELKSKFLTGVAPQKIGPPIENAQLGRLIDLIESHYQGAEGKINSILEDFGLKFSQNKQRLSGGQERILFFALAQAGSPKLLILDEPTTFLDTEDTENNVSKLTKFWKHLQNFHDEGNTVLLISHDREIGVQPTRTIWLKDGRLNESFDVNNSEESSDKEVDSNLIHSDNEVGALHWLYLLRKHVKFNIQQTFQADRKDIWLTFIASFLWAVCISFTAKIGSSEDSSSVYTIAIFYSSYLAMTAAKSTGNIIAEERQNEILTKFLKVLPLPPIIYLSAKVIAAWLITSLLILTMLFITLFSNVISPSIFISLLGSLILGVIPYLFLGLALGYLFDKPKNIQIAALMSSLILTIPVFSRPILQVIETVFATPGKLNIAALIGDNVAAHSPIYHYIQIILFSGKAPEYDRYLWLHLGWLIWFTLISILIALWAYWRTCKQEAQA